METERGESYLGSALKSYSLTPFITVVVNILLFNT